MKLERRTFLQLAASSTAAALMPRVSFAGAGIEARLVLVILRGALDGLAAVPAYGDSQYAKVRGELAIASTERKLDGVFALHPALTHLHERYLAKELVVFHSIATPYRERSHFDGQDLLENGTMTAKATRDGWLNRMLPVLSRSSEQSTEELAVAIAQNVPLVLRGESRVNSWAPSRLPETDADTLQRIADLYSHEPYFATRLQTALAADAVAGEMTQAASNRRDPLNALSTLTEAAGKFLSAQKGPRIAVIESGGWDTHANQGAERGQLANRLGALDRALDGLRAALGSAWKQTAVAVVTEFGRTVAVNGTRGTDHGTGTCSFLLGGAVAGGRVIADWPGLTRSALYQGRDLMPTMDLRSVLKGVLASHLDIIERDLESTVFPESSSAKPVPGLIRESRAGAGS